MDRRVNYVPLLLFVSGLLSNTVMLAEETDRERKVRRAVTYLSAEVARWKTEHDCYSCHHHGDGARALFAASRLRLESPSAALQVALDWLQKPDRWDANGPDGPFSDRQLARIQFAAALAEASVQQFIRDEEPLKRAARDLAGEQLSSGAWDFAGADLVGGATTYGRTLATVQAKRAILIADPNQTSFGEAIRRSNAWLRQRDVKSVLDAAAVLWGLDGAHDVEAVEQRSRCRELVYRGQTGEGGWGPYVNSAPEPFDTAIAVLGLSAELDDRSRQARKAGIEYLLRTQLSDGSWPETTRPLPRESYSQRISTTAWATLALLSPDP